jgi:hypothetical protein
MHTGVCVLIGEAVEPIGLELWMLEAKAGGVEVGCKWWRGRVKVKSRGDSRREFSGPVPTLATHEASEPHSFHLSTMDVFRASCRY